jgi:hypothetical protein
MRLVAVTKILDEADIVEAFARHTAHYVSHHIFLDNGSTDGTVGILRQLRHEGLEITVLQNGSRWYNEAIYNTYLYRVAVAERGADWVIFLDADEFIDDRQAVGGLVAMLEQTRADLSCLCIAVVNYRASVRDDPEESLIPARIGWYDVRNDLPHTIVRRNLANRNIEVQAGNHFVLIDEGERCPSENLPTVVLAHYPERSPFQTITKTVRGWSRVLAAGESEIAKGTSCHYRPTFELLRDNPQELLLSPWLRSFGRSTEGMTFDPIAYHGGPLRFTPPTDDAMRSVRSLVGYVEHLSREFGRLLEECPGAREMAAEWAMTFTKIVELPAAKFVDPPLESERLNEFLRGLESNIVPPPIDAKDDVLAGPEQVAAAPQVPGGGLVPAGITAHAQNLGDIAGSLGDWIGERRSSLWIEGFSITPPQDIPPEELLYRVVLKRDQLSPWTPSGQFCGSKGLGLPLLGFCLTLRGAAAVNYDCSYAATFVDGSVVGSAPGGQVCASATLAPLEAFQINLRPVTVPSLGT